MKKCFKKLLVTVMAFSLVVPAVVAPEAEAAKKPVSVTKKVTVNVGKTKKVKVTTKKKVKKTTWTLDKKGEKVVKLSKKTKKNVTIKGKKAGKGTLTAKVKVGKKTYKLKTKITVKKVVVDNTPTPAPATTKPTEKPTVAPATPTPTPTPIPTFRALNKSYKNIAEIPAQEYDVFPTTPPSPKVDAATAVAYDVDFEDVEVGTTTQDAITGAGIKGAVLRGCDDSSQTGTDKLEVVDGSTLTYAEDDATTNETKVLRCYRQVKTWQGPMFDLTEELDEGCTYTFSADVYSPGTDVMGSYQLQTTEDTAATFGNFGPNSNSITKIVKGEWQHVDFTISIPDDKYYYALYFESYNGGSNADIYVDNIKLTKTVETSRQEGLTALKDVYGDIFDVVGVGAGVDSLFGKSGSEFITSQYNAYTPGNEMKVDALLGSTASVITVEEAKALGYVIPDNYCNYEDNKKGDDFVVPDIDFTAVDQILKTCHDKGLKLRGHTLLWHEQTPAYFFQASYRTASAAKYRTTKEVMDTRLEFYIKTVMTHILESEYSDCLYAYDVVNEYLHSKNAASNAKPTFWGEIYGISDDGFAGQNGVSLRPSFVKDAFKYTDEMLKKYNRKDVKLFYNDFNCYQYPEDIVLLTDFINEDGVICDGIGMQSHLDITNAFHSAHNYAKALECFRLNANNLEIHITELDATMQSTETNILTDEHQAAFYDQIMNAILTNKKNGGNITGFIIWSLYDGVSWRNLQFPCIFSGLFAPKSAYYAVIDAKERYWDAE